MEKTTVHLFWLVTIFATAKCDDIIDLRDRVSVNSDFKEKRIMIHSYLSAIVSRVCRAVPIFAVLFTTLFLPCRSVLATEVFRFYVPAASHPEEQPTALCEAKLLLMALDNDTTYALYNLDNLVGGPVSTGQIKEHETQLIFPIELSSDGYYQLETSSMVLAYLGDDCLNQNYGGSFFYPMSNGRSFIGEEFIINIPLLSTHNEFIVFAYEDSLVTIEDLNGTVVVSQSMKANSFWEPTGISENRYYRVVSSGSISLQSNSRTGYTTVPGQYTNNLTSCYNDVATTLLFATWEGDQSNVVVVFAYENAKITLWDLRNPADKGISADLLEGETWRHEAGGSDPAYWRLEVAEGKRVAVRAGSERLDGDVAHMGDDIAFSPGFNSYRHYLHSVTEGGHIFANSDNTKVDLTELPASKTTHTLDSTEYLVLEPAVDWLVESDLPTMAETLAGIPTEKQVELTSFGSFIPPTFVLDANDNKIHDHMEDFDKDGNPNACDMDDDGDGIADHEDNCPLAAEDIDGDLDDDGCPETPGDRDGDGILDVDDACPDRPEDMDGDSDKDGCPENAGDLDGDGVPNDEDPCPEDPEDFDGNYDTDGCPETDDDRDGDGISDADDNCPGVYNPDQADADNDGIGDACEDSDGEGLPLVGATGTGALWSCSTNRQSERLKPRSRLLLGLLSYLLN